MSRSLKNTLRAMGWLLLSHILCLVLAFSFAILPQAAMQWLSLFCCLLAHVLLMGNCGMSIAKEHLVCYRQDKIIVPLWQTVCIGLFTAIPALLLYALLWILSDSVGYLNLYLLLNAPVIQILHLIVQEAETFSALSALQRIWMALLPFLSTVSLLGGYLLVYPKELAKEIAQREK